MTKQTFFLFLYILTAIQLKAQVSVQDVPEQLKKANPGDTVVVANGVYKDVELTVNKQGHAQKPIVIIAQTPGGVVLSGQSSIRIGGTGLELNGFYLTNGYAPKGAVIEFRAGNEAANYCRVTNTVIENYNLPNRETDNSWVLLYGRHNRFDHNSISGKLNNGVTLAVILDEERHQKNFHRIEYNYFGKRPNLGSNGGETIRVGTSQSSLSSSNSIIQQNFFEHCDGEVEIVSIKSCDNIIRKNTFYESMGVLALRHGHRNLVEGNVFIGNNKPYTGGIRVINEGHMISNNYFYKLTGDRFFAALAIMNAVPNSLPNRYHQVKDVKISDNTWVDCQNILMGVGKDNERTQAASNVLLSNNVFYNKASDVVYTSYDKTDGFRFQNNKVVTRSGKFSKPGFAESKIEKPLISPQLAVEKTACGAAWFKPVTPSVRTLSGQKIIVKTGQNTLNAAIEKSQPGDIIELSEKGEYLVDKSLELKHYLRIQGAASLHEKPVIRYNGSKGRQAVITINDGGILEMQSIAFNDEAFPGKAAATAAISPAPIMRGFYSAYINNCEFYNFQEASYSPFRALKSTYADTLIFTNCLFRDMSGDAIYLSAEKEDAGKYSAEYVEVKNCAFYKVLGYAVDLYRGGSDESTTGPTIDIDHCVLEDVNNKERGSGIRLFGVQNIKVRNTIFSNTGRGGASIRLDETNWDKIHISHCTLYNSGKVSSFWGKVIKGPMYTLKPDFVSVDQYNFNLSANSSLKNKASDGKAIGLIQLADQLKPITKR